MQAERRAKIVAAYRQELIAKKKKWQLVEAKRVLELDGNLIVIAVLITALPSRINPLLQCGVLEHRRSASNFWPLSHL